MITLDTIINETLDLFLLGVFSFAVAILLTPIYTHFAYKHKFWKRSRTHSTTGEKLEIISKFRIKRQVPLMAGLVTIATITIVTVIGNLDRNQTWLPLAALIGGGFVGLIDDIINIRGKGGTFAGLRPKVKFLMITAVALAAALFFYYKLGFSTIYVPFTGSVELGLLVIPLFTFVVVGTGNAVNITDGVDGLAGGLLGTAFGAFGAIAMLQGNFGIAGFCFTVVGAILAYLWFNIPPARFFMGDVGSFGLGTSLGVVAMLTDTLLLLPVIGFIFVMETASVIINITSKKLRNGKRVFLSSPIHHHFEATGWPKTKVTMRFWVLGQVFAFVGIIIALVGGFVA